jgi:hypothetical protein
MPENADEIQYRFTPQFEGAFLRDVPKRDLTRRDVERLDPLLLRDALTPHPLYGTPLYTAVDAEPPPKWWAEKLAEAQKAGVAVEPRLPNESKQAYEERVAALNAPPDDAPEPPAEDGEA